jgi:hypothetical protein
MGYFYIKKHCCQTNYNNSLLFKTSPPNPLSKGDGGLEPLTSKDFK